MLSRSTTAQSAAMRRWNSPAIVTLAAIAALPALTGTAAARRARPAPPPKEATAPREAGEPIMAIVSIKSQQVTFYDAEGWILRAPVSTGVKGRETPAGIFAVIEKGLDHHSTMYDDAWMPHMQRITWNGVALHGGPLPGYAASHGCVRMPFGFAEKLFDRTRIGMRVIISPNDAEPVDFFHRALFMPKAEALAAAPARAETLAREATEAAKAAEEAKKAAATAARNTHRPARDGGGEVFDSFEVPVTIRDPGKPIGTHLFTAMARNDAGLRWSAVTIDNGDDAKSALDRITIPRDVLDRIAPTALPRSSIVISDEPLSAETNYRTEFVAVLSNQPQGGFITRKPTTDVLVADTNGDDGFGWFSQRGWSAQPGNSPQRNWDYQRGWGPQPGSQRGLGPQPGNSGWRGDPYLRREQSW